MGCDSLVQATLFTVDGNNITVKASDDLELDEGKLFVGNPFLCVQSLQLKGEMLMVPSSGHSAEPVKVVLVSLN